MLFQMVMLCILGLTYKHDICLVEKPVNNAFTLINK